MRQSVVFGLPCGGMLYGVFALFLLNANTAFAASKASAKPSAAQNSAPVYTLKASARLVVVDVVVLDRNHKPVLGLRPSDFRVFENRTPQTTLYFNAHTGSVTPEAPEVASALASLPPATYINLPGTPASDTVDVLLLDALNTPMANQSYVRSEMLRYLKTLPPGRRIAIFTLASRLRLILGFTGDTSTLLHVLTDPKYAQEQSALMNSNETEDLEQNQVQSVASLSQPPPQLQTRQTPETQAMQIAASMQQFNADMESFQTDVRVRITLDSLGEIARYLSALPGRKNLLWFSASFPLSVNAATNSPDPFSAMRMYQEQVQQTTRLLTEARVAVYPIDARGLMVTPSDDASVHGGPYAFPHNSYGKSVTKFIVSTNAENAAMDQIAEETGGRAIYSSNDLKGAMAQVIENGADYYTLVYRPTDANWDGRFRHIEVKANCKGCTLQYRQGYYATQNAAQGQLGAGQNNPLRQFTAEMSHGLPDFSQILYKVHLEAVHPQPSAEAAIAGEAKKLPGARTRYAIEYAALLHDIHFVEDASQVHHSKLNFAAIAFDAEGNQLNATLQQVEYNLTPTTYAALQQKGLQYTQYLDIPAGTAYLRTGIFDPDTGKIGTDEVTLAPAAAHP